MTKKQKLAAKLSLAFLWIFTGLTSLFFAPEVGYQILETGGVDGGFADLCLISGSLTDMIIGIWILTGFKEKLCYQIQISVIALFTILLTGIDASYWFHPFGPVTKNLPIAVLVWLYYSSINEKKA
jgi:hypothetical protein